MNNRIKLPKSSKVVVREGMFCAGKDEFGTDYITDFYQVQIQLESGITHNHGHTFWATEAIVTPDGFNFFPDYSEEKKAAAEHLADRVRRAGAVDLQHWNEGEPVYGTQAYLGAVSQMTPAQLAE
jgi:hypothetical protein